MNYDDNVNILIIFAKEISRIDEILLRNNKDHECYYLQFTPYVLE